MLKIVVEEHMSKEREKAIHQVAESVTELADIFKEIQVLVIDQVQQCHRPLARLGTHANLGTHCEHSPPSSVRVVSVSQKPGETGGEGSGGASAISGRGGRQRGKAASRGARARTRRCSGDCPVWSYQGTVLDRIDFNIEQAADRVGAAVVELNKANDYQKKSKTMLCIYLLLLLCGIMVIILIIKYMLK